MQLSDKSERSYHSKEDTKNNIGLTLPRLGENLRATMRLRGLVFDGCGFRFVLLLTPRCLKVLLKILKCFEHCCVVQRISETWQNRHKLRLLRVERTTYMHLVLPNAVKWQRLTKQIVLFLVSKF